ncbi:MAG: hypothetical protein WCD63_01855, partial [Terrimicrobiaceae bacterium]
ATRRRAELLVSAAYATPVAAGQNLLPRMPKTEIWGLLYARVAQIDGEDYRNVLLARGARCLSFRRLMSARRSKP